MPLETATTIAGLNALWPLGSDSKGQGDDHLRLIKSVLQTDPILAAASTAQGRNRVVNPAFQVSQENLNAAGTALSYYAADQWQTNWIGTGTFTSQRVQSPTPKDSRDRYRVTITVADAALAAGDYLNIRTSIEGGKVADFRYGSASARQSILRFGIKAPAGTYSIRLRNSAGDRSHIANFTISAGQANTDTEQTFVIPGDVTGTWLSDTGVGIVVDIVFAAGITYQGIAGWQAGNVFATSANTNGMAVAGAAYELFDVGLYLDPNNTGKAPPWVMPDEADELIACQRYWEDIGTYGMFWSGNTTTSSTYYGVGYWKVRKRAVPALTASPATASGFPNTVGTLVGAIDTGREARVSNATLSGGYFYSNAVVANARM